MSLLQNADISSYFVWQQLFKQIHLALVKWKVGDNSSNIGVSFPEYNANSFKLGTKLRIFSEDERALENMNCENLLNRLSDYVYVGLVAEVPKQITNHACFRHVKMKGNKEKLARRRAKRSGKTFEQVVLDYKDFKEQHIDLPFINMVSATNGHRFKLFIEKQEKREPCKGSYSCYGLSSSTTVPLF